jgi:urease accessory protein
MREHSIFRSVFRSLAQRHWLAKVGVFAALIYATVGSSDPALAHHAMGGGLPTTFAQGLLSGIAHPIIGPDHFAFIVAIGLLAATKPQGVLIPLAFIFTAMMGTGAHLMQWSLPGVELFVSGSILLFGILLALRNSPKTVTIAALSSLAGLFHGYAYGESIFGAEPTPLIAYLIGFTIIQLVVAGTAFCLGQQFFAQRIGHTLPRFRSAGLVISGIGVAFFLSQLVEILLPT